jgi:hypothetical protein
MLDDSELPLDGAIWVSQALSSKRTVSAGGDGRLEVSNAVAIEEHVFAALVKLVTGVSVRTRSEGHWIKMFAGRAAS